MNEKIRRLAESTRATDELYGRQGPGNLLQEDDTAANEREVIEAAKVWRIKQLHSDAGDEDEALNQLADAVDALTAPQAVKPETLKPGQQFRFVNGEGVTISNVFRAVEVDEEGMRWMGGSYTAIHFAPNDRVIPIEDSKP